MELKWKAEGRVPTVGENEAEMVELRKQIHRERANAARRVRNEAMRSLGLKKVRGALGGTYWE